MSERETWFTKECIQRILLMPEDKLEGRIKLGYNQPKGRAGKRRDIWRIGDYNDCKYEEDPVKSVRILVQDKETKKLDKKESSIKKSKKSKINEDGIFQLGCLSAFEWEKFFKPKIKYEYKLSDKDDIEEWIEELKNPKSYTLKTDIELAEILDEKLCLNQLKIFGIEINEDKTSIKVNNPWIQIVLGILIMTKDFVSYNKNFNIETIKKDNILTLFDAYWNFSPKDPVFAVEASKQEFKDVIFESKK